MKTIISIIGTVGIPASYGGFETLTENLTKNLSDRFDITVFCSSKHYLCKQENYNGAKLKYINLNANGIQSIIYDIISIFRSIRFADTILILGISGCIVLPFIKLFTNKNIIVNIDGLEWKRAKWNKYVKCFLKYSEKVAVKAADKIITDNKAIKDYVKDEYSIESNLIAYGGDHVLFESLKEDTIKNYPFINTKYAFKVCRIEPENNVHLILEAFALYPKLNIVIVGNWENSAYGINLKDQYQNYENIFLLCPIYDQVILNQFRSNCLLYIHGHSAGGTNPSLVEAMYLGLPIISLDVSYNRETTYNKAIYFKNVEDLLGILKKLSDSELEKIGNNMKSIALEHYTWKIISEKYAKLI